MLVLIKQKECRVNDDSFSILARYFSLGSKRVVEDFGPTPFIIIGLKDVGTRISLESYHTRVEAHLGGIYVQNTVYNDPHDEVNSIEREHVGDL